MARVQDEAVLKQIRTLFNLGETSDLSDGRLLELFVSRQGAGAEAAFATLLERHGRMVFRTCRGIVQNDHDAEDAFQATFLILVKRGAGLWVGDSLGPWLHRTACRLALKMARATSRRESARLGAHEIADERPGRGGSDEAARTLHEEIDRLPERYRGPVILCLVEERSYDEAARRLGCPVGTVKSRPARGREKLRERLVRRGLVPSAVFGAGASTGKPLSAALLTATAHAALWDVTGKASGGPPSASIAALTAGAIRSLAMAKLYQCAFMGIILGAGAIGAGTLLPRGVVLQAVGASDPEEPKARDDRRELETLRG
jgi:RNA polymerase sigma-70 factor (ECF subfamily)